MRLRPLVLGSFFLLALASGMHCGSSDPKVDPAPSSTAEGAYKGAMIGERFAAELTLTIGSSLTKTQTVRLLANGDPVTITGTITSSALGVPIALSGTYDPKSQSITFSGASPKGEFAFSGKLENGVISGPPATTPFGPVPLVVVKTLLDLRVYCGESEAPTRGYVGGFSFGDRAGAAYALENGPRDVLLAGTFRGGDLTVEGNGARLAGTVRGGTWSGSLTAPNGAVGAFSATEGRCATLVASLLDGGTEGGPSPESGVDGGPDAGPPIPERVMTIPAPGPGFIALSGTSLYYTVNHTYFSQKLEVASLKTDGTDALTVIPVNNPATEPRAIAAGLTVANGNVYVLGPSDPPGGAAVTLYSVPTSGGPFTTLTLTGTPGFREYAQSLASDGTGLYRGECTSSGSAIRGYGFGGTAQGTLTGPLNPCVVVSDGTNLFAGAATGILRVPNTIATQAQPPTSSPIAASNTYPLAGADPLVYAIAVDATHVYWGATNNAAKTAGVFRKPKDGSGTVEMLTQSTGSLRGSMALDDTYAWFFVQSSSGQASSTAALMRIPKTARNGVAQLVGDATPISVVSDGRYAYYASGNDLMKAKSTR